MAIDNRTFEIKVKVMKEKEKLFLVFKMSLLLKSNNDFSL